MRRRILSFIASSPHLCMLLLFCFASQTTFGQQLLPPTNNASLELLYSLLLCSPINTLPTSDTIALESGRDTDMLAVADSAAAADDRLTAEAQAAVDTETEMMLERFAEMIEEEPQELGNLRLYRFIDDWYGVRYKYGGTTIRGIDCSAFSQKVYNQIFCTGLRRTSRQQYRYSERIKHADEAAEGDLVFFKVNRVRISHVGIYLANGYFVHASRSKGITISNLADRYWHRRYAGCGRIERPHVSISESGMAQE